MSATFSIADQCQTATVLDVARDTITLSLATLAAHPLVEGTTLHDVVIHAANRAPVVLPLLDLASHLEDEDGDALLTLEAADDVTRAGLWLISQRVTTAIAGIEPLESAVNTAVGSIPARGKYTEAARLERLAFIRQETGAHLASLEHTTLIPRRLTGNIENLVASVELPVGLAGPLLFHGEHARGVIYAPLATTEGTLVASATRGARAITRSGGVTTRVLAQRMLRVPLFVLSKLQGALLFSNWIRDHVDAIREQVRQVSEHAYLSSVEPKVLGRQVHVAFLYETGDAAGQNMTTTCTWHACQWLMAQMKHFEEIVFDNFVIEANMSSDKKVTFQSFLNGRGTRVIAEAYLDRTTVEEILKVTPEQLASTYLGFMAGSFQVGMVGFNVNVSNVIAAIFAATGQDIACVHESSLGQLQLERVGDGIHASLLLPSLIVGTVGGGTHLQRQRDLLDMMGCAGAGKAARFAEAIAGFCLALDLSTLSAIAGGQFANAHERLGRNRPVKWFQLEDLSPDLLEPGVQQTLGDDTVHVEEVEAIEGVELGSSIITELTARKVRKLVGLIPLRLHTHSARTGRSTLDLIAKVKPIDAEVILMTNAMASMCGPGLAKAYSRFKNRTDFVDCHVRELEVYRQTDPRFTRHTPAVYDVIQDDSREAYILVLERLQNMLLMDTADDVSGWRQEHIEAALAGIAEVHAIWYDRERELRAMPWIGAPQTAQSMTEMSELWEALAVHAREEFPEWISRTDLALYRELVGNIPDWWGRLETHPKTLIHNDFNPRNLCFRPTDAGPRLCAYDWELATVHLPQHDLAELLAFVLADTVEPEVVDHYVEFHRVQLARATGRAIDAEQWRAGYNLSVRDLIVNRFGLYVMAHTFRHYGFMQRAVWTVRRLLAIETGFE